MMRSEADAIFNELNDAFELRLDELKKERKVPTEKYREEVLRFCEEREEEYGIEYFLEESTQFLKSETAFIRVDAVLQGRFDKYLYMSLCYYHLASVVSDRERITDGCKYLQYAMYFYGKWQGSREYKEWAGEKEKNEKDRIENARAGKEEKYIPVKCEIIRLLHSRKPMGKWSSVSKAIEGIQHDLDIFITNEPKDKPSGLEPDNLDRTIKSWIKKDRYLAFAFSEAVTKK